MATAPEKNAPPASDPEELQAEDFQKAADLAKDAAAKTVGEAKDALQPEATKYTVLAPLAEQMSHLAGLLAGRLLPTAYAGPQDSAGDEFSKAGQHAKRSAQHTGAAFDKLASDTADSVKSNARAFGNKVDEAAKDVQEGSKDAYYSAKDSAGDAADYAQDRLQEGKQEVKGLFSSIGDFFRGAKDDAKEAAGEVQDAAREAGRGRNNVNRNLDDVERNAQRVSAGLRGYAAEAKDAAVDAYEATKAKGREAADRAGDYLNGAADEARGGRRGPGLDRGVREARSQAHETLDRAEAKGHRAVDAASNYYQDTKDYIEDSWRGAKRGVREGVDDTKDYIRDSARSVKDSFVQAAEDAKPKSNWDYMKGLGVPPSDSATEFAKRMGRRT